MLSEELVNALDNEAMAEVLKLSELEVGSEAHSKGTEAVGKLLSTISQIQKTENEMWRQSEKDAAEERLKREELEIARVRNEIEARAKHDQKKSEYIKMGLGAVGTIITAIILNDRATKCMIFEQTGVFRSTASKMTQRMYDGFMNSLTRKIGF